MKKFMDRTSRQLRLMIGRCVIQAAQAGGGRVLVSIDGLDGEQATDVEMAEPFGFTGVPLPGGEGVALSLMNSRDRQVVLPMGNRAHRPRDLAGGEVAMFDHLGHKIIIRNDGVEIISPDALRITAPNIAITATSATINDKPIATVDDQVQVTGGSSAGLHPIVTGVGS